MSQHGGKNTSELLIPPRWLRCPRRGKIIADKFIPFKTPLDSKYDSQVSEEFRFPVSMLLTFVLSQKIKLNFWIDLTNTERFYDKKEVENAGLRYLKLNCKGHSERPTQDQTQTFIEVCEKYISKNPLDVIGIHCTHGFNRTGFLICSYLVEKLCWSIDAALQAFSLARPPGIYKGDYLEELYSKYSDRRDPPPAPLLPDWCSESDDSVDDDGQALNENGKEESNHNNDPTRRRRREIIRKDATFMEGVNGVVALEQPSLTQIQRQCQNMCGWENSGFPGSQPVSMDTENIKLLRSKPYKVSWKADGIRYMMLIDGENEVYMIDRDNTVFKIPNLRFPNRKDPNSNLTNTLLDGEMIIDKFEGQNIPRYLVYDIIKFQGKDVGGTDFDRRLLCIRKEIIAPRVTLMRQCKLDKTKEPFSIRPKEFWNLPEVEKLFTGTFVSQVSHETDGLIFQPQTDPYKCGKSPDVLKWKPPSLNSVDFKFEIKKSKPSPGMLREVTGFLFVGSYDGPFSRIKITKELKEYNNKIIECAFENGEWKFLRERTDKSFPNSCQTALAVCNSIQKPITKELLLEYANVKRYNSPNAKRPPHPTDRKPPVAPDSELMPPPKQPNHPPSSLRGPELKLEHGDSKHSNAPDSGKNNIPPDNKPSLPLNKDNSPPNKRQRLLSPDAQDIIQ